MRLGGNFFSSNCALRPSERNDESSSLEPTRGLVIESSCAGGVGGVLVSTAFAAACPIAPRLRSVGENKLMTLVGGVGGNVWQLSEMRTRVAGDASGGVIEPFDTTLRGN